MTTTCDDTSERILKRLAKRLLRCPFDEEVFDSKAALKEHLEGAHSDEICGEKLIPKQDGLREIEPPTRLTFCGHCLNFVVPNGPCRNATTEVDRHIRAEHPNPSGPRELKIRVTSDPDLIAQFIEADKFTRVFECSELGCSAISRTKLDAAEHWVETHCFCPSVEDVRKLMEADPERFGALLEECFKAELEQERTDRLCQRESDAYPVRHYPNVPRIRSRPSEYIVYVDGEKATVNREDYDEMLAIVGTDAENEDAPRDTWTRQTIHLDLRFCNIEDGYVPLTRDVKSLLPKDWDGKIIQVSWQDDPTLFDCVVNASKRAIYNADGKLKQLFAGLPSGVRLYITRAGESQYEFCLQAKRHTVPNCKVFTLTNTNQWKVETRDLELEWETGDSVFRHQSTFNEMPALYQEAQQTALSVRDAVYEYMRETARERAVSIKEVHEFVFWRKRTCSPAAVWSQFRKEHECYVREGPGRYRFDDSKPLPRVRVLPPTAGIEPNAERVVTGERAPDSGITIEIRWSVILNQPCPNQMIKFRDVGKTQAEFLRSLISVFGNEHPLTQRLLNLVMNRRFRLSRNPADFVSLDGRTQYGSKEIIGTGLHLCTHGSTDEKAKTIRRIVRELGLPNGSVEVTVKETPNLRQILAAL